MSLTLTAEQKTIEKIFSGSEKYIIPAYQRAYSWDEEQCSDFFEDIKNSFLDDPSEGYFIGNIVIAKSYELEDSLEVIDGQQRLITLTLFMKVLLEFVPTNSGLDDALWIKDRFDREKKEQRVQTRVFDDKDSKYLKDVLITEFKDMCNQKQTNTFIKNICFFYKKLKEFMHVNDIKEFSIFLLDKVTLLPIESTDSKQDKAREKALKIFETINNRGRPLSDTDIFKANLYSMALNELEEDSFIEQWENLDFECENISLSGFNILRVFKIYSYKIRGEQGIKSSEIGLRDFFAKKDYSPFKNKSYREIMNDLFEIIKAIKYYERIIQNPSENNELSKWFQLIDIYTNNYPKDLLIVFLVKYLNRDNLPIKFVESLVRYCYFQGSTTRVKSTIYDWTIKVMYDKWSEYYPKDYTEKDYNYGGKLYKGYGLLAIYLEKNAIYPYHVKRLRDVTDFTYPDYSYYDKTGHTVVLDAKNFILEDYDFSGFNEKLYKLRNKKIKNKLKEFFRNPNED